MAEEQTEQNSKSTGYAEPTNPEAGLDEDAGSQIGKQAQMAKEIIGQRSKQLKGMRSGIRLSRRRARGRGRSLGF